MAQTAVEWLITLYQQTNKIDMFDLEVAKQKEQDQMARDYNEKGMKKDTMMEENKNK